MARLDSATISRRTVEVLPVGEREAVYWDSELQGFGVRVYPSGSKVYLVQTRADGKSRRLTVGLHGLISAELARRKAAQVIANIKAGNEPVLDNGASRTDAGPTVAEVTERYMREHVMVRCKPTTVRHCRHILDRPQQCPHRPPLIRRGGSHPLSPPAAISPSLVLRVWPFPPARGRPWVSPPHIPDAR